MADVSTKKRKSKENNVESVAPKKKKEASASKPKKRRNWTHEETLGLLEMWGAREHQQGFEGMKYNSRVWAAITAEFISRFPGCPYNTWESLKERVEYLRKKYREAKKVNNASGRGRVSSPFFEELDDILGRRPMNNVKAHHHMDADLSSDSEDDSASPRPDTGDSTQHSLSPASADFSQDSDVDMPDADDELLDSSLEPPPSDDSIIPPTVEDVAEPGPGPSGSTGKKQDKHDKHDGTVVRRRRGKKSQVEDAVDKIVTRLIASQEKQSGESTLALLNLEKDRFAWEKQKEEERERQEQQWRRDQLALEERRMQSNNQMLLQLAAIFANGGQGGQQPRTQPGRMAPPNAHQAVPPYVDHSSFEDFGYWQDTHKM